MPKLKRARPMLLHYRALPEPQAALCLSTDERKDPTEYYVVGEHFGSFVLADQHVSRQGPNPFPVTYEWVDPTDAHRAIAEKFDVQLEEG